MNKNRNIAIEAAREINNNEYSYDGGGCDVLTTTDFIEAAIEKAMKPLLTAVHKVLPEIGWRGKGPDDNYLYYCEFCRVAHENWVKIQHTDSCPVRILRQFEGVKS